MAEGSTTVLLDLYLCEGPLTDVKGCMSEVLAIIEREGMRVRQAVPDSWEDGSYNLYFSLEESKVHIETWPDKGHAKVTVDLCNFSKDNSRSAAVIADKIARYFRAGRKFKKTLARGPIENQLDRYTVYASWEQCPHASGAS